jgi:hypothetical protein
MTLSIIDTQHNNAMNYAECHHAECRIYYCCAECHHAECRYAECHYAECSGALRICKGQPNWAGAKSFSQLVI